MEAQLSTLNGRVGRVEYEAIDGGRSGIRMKVTTSSKDDAKVETFTAPPIAGRMTNGAGVIYLIPTAHSGTVETYTSEQVHKGEAFRASGYPRIASKMKGEALEAWYAVAETFPVTSPSPDVLTAWPPLAPALEVMNADREDARAAAAELAHRLSPAGRFIVGLGLFSPWLGVMPGATSILVNCVGRKGSGKSTVAEAVAALFGAHKIGARDGLAQGANSTALGMLTKAQKRAYLPVIADEVTTFTTSGGIEATLANLVSGGQRARSGRDGLSISSDAQWHGLLVTTSNDPLGLTHEMWERRAFEVEGPMLWTGVPDAKVDPARAAQWWREVYGMLDRIAGTPWEVLAEAYPPGTIEARDVVSLALAVPMPGSESLAVSATLGVAGCQWLSAWTDDVEWELGVWDAASALIAATQAAERDVVADAAEDLLDDWSSRPAAWGDGHPDDRAPVTVARLSSVGVPACSVEHSPTPCAWYDVRARAFEDIVSTSVTRLMAEGFARAIYSPERGRWTRKASQPGTNIRPRVYTVCMSALTAMTSVEELPEQDSAPVAAFAFPDPFAPDAPSVVPPVPRVAPVASPVASAPVSVEPVADDAPRRIESDSADRPGARRFVAFDGDLADGLAFAVTQGATDVVGPRTWRIDDAPEWSPRSRSGTALSSMLMTGPAGQVVRMWPAKQGATPEAYARGLATFEREVAPGIVSPPMVAQDFIRGYDQGQAPRFNLGADALPWTDEHAVLSPGRWGAKPEPGEADQWDRVKAHVTALEQVKVAPLRYGEAWEQVDGASVDVSKVSGMVLVEVPASPSGPLPSVFGNLEPGSVQWVTTELVRFALHLGESPRIIRGVVAPTGNVAALGALGRASRRWLARYEHDDARLVAKSVYQSAAGSLMSQGFAGKPNRVYRPDWGLAIRDNAWASTVNAAHKAHAADPRFVPVCVNVDAIYYPPGLGTLPGVPVGDVIGHFKEA